MNIIKSQNDNRKYKSIILPNKLKILLISDPTTDIGAASLSVHIGNYYDPEEYPGLAHFLEHMLFMGSKKYTGENYYFKYLNEHGGISNAYTAGEQTTYFFNLNISHFATALDIFSQFFIAPLFKKDSMKREINAVDSEHSKNLTSDDWRINRILQTISRKEHPFHKFSTGNKDTMKAGIREKMIEFYNKYYSANLMNLVIIWNKSLAECEKLVKTLFSSVKNNDISRKIYNGQPYDTTPPQNTKNPVCHKLIKMIPIADINTLYIVWQLPNMDKYFKNKPVEYITKLLGQESNGSIYNILKSKGLGDSIFAGLYYSDDSVYLLMISVELTDKGYIHIPMIVDIIYNYIDIIKQSIQSWIYDEMKNIHEIIFKYIDEINPIDYVSNLSSYMLKYPIQHVINADYVYNSFTNINKKLIQKCLSYMQNKNSIVIINSKKNKLINPLKEKYYDILYTVEDDPNLLLLSEHSDKKQSFSSDKELRSSSETRSVLEERSSLEPSGARLPQKAIKAIKAISLPRKNIFISKNPKLLPKTKNDKHPQKLNNKHIEVWFKKDNKYNIPRIIINTYIHLPKIFSSAKNVIISNIYVRLFDNIMRSDLDYVTTANSSFIIMLYEDYIQIHIDAYNDIIMKILHKFINAFSSIDINKQIFNIVKKEYKKDIQNFIYNTPLIHSIEYLKEKIYNKYYTHTDLLNIIDKINLKDINLFTSWLPNNKVKTFIYGNLNTTYVENITTYFEKFGTTSSTSKYYNKIKEINEGEIELYMRQSFNPYEKDSFISVFYEIGNIKKGVTDLWDQKIIMLMIINKLTTERFFDKLRTVEQTGYIVKSYITIMGDSKEPLYGLSFMIQSRKKQPHVLIKKIKSFLNNTSDFIQKLNIDQYNQYINTLEKEILKKDTSRIEEFDKHWNVILDNSYMFNLRKHLAKTLKNISQNNTYRFFNKYFINKNTKRMRIVEFYPNLFKSAEKIDLNNINI